MKGYRVEVFFEGRSALEMFVTAIDKIDAERIANMTWGGMGVTFEVTAI